MTDLWYNGRKRTPKQIISETMRDIKDEDLQQKYPYNIPTPPAESLADMRAKRKRAEHEAEQADRERMEARELADATDPEQNEWLMSRNDGEWRGYMADPQNVIAAVVFLALASAFIVGLLFWVGVL